MSAEKIPAYVSLDAYNASEMEADTRSEYYNGVIVAMSGGSRSHIEMTRNISSEAAFQLRNSSCRWYTSDLCVYSPDCNSIFYPDMTVTCQTPQFANTRLATLLNPTLIVAILSASTEGRDRGEKFACYRTIPSFSTYVLLAQDRPHAEVYTRQADGSWRLEEFSEINTVLKLPAIGCELRFTDIYQRHLSDPACEVFTSEQRVSVPRYNRYFYPDVVVACEEPQFENIQGVRSMQNPVLIVEVLSTSTEREDRSSKFVCYQTLQSLHVYVLVSQNKPLVETFTREPDGAWRHDQYEGLDAIVPLPALRCELRLAAVYKCITFPPPLQDTDDRRQT